MLLFGYSAFTMYIFPERSLDEECIKHLKHTLGKTIGGKLLGLKNGKTCIMFSNGAPIHTYLLDSFKKWVSQFLSFLLCSNC